MGADRYQGSAVSHLSLFFSLSSLLFLSLVAFVFCQSTIVIILFFDSKWISEKYQQTKLLRGCGGLVDITKINIFSNTIFIYFHSSKYKFIPNYKLPISIMPISTFATEVRSDVENRRPRQK